jgi:hypothetical protein
MDWAGRLFSSIVYDVPLLTVTSTSEYNQDSRFTNNKNTNNSSSTTAPPTHKWRLIFWFWILRTLRLFFFFVCLYCNKERWALVGGSRIEEMRHHQKSQKTPSLIFLPYIHIIQYTDLETVRLFFLQRRRVSCNKKGLELSQSSVPQFPRHGRRGGVNLHKILSTVIKRPWVVESGILIGLHKIIPYKWEGGAEFIFYIKGIIIRFIHMIYSFMGIIIYWRMSN